MNNIGTGTGTSTGTTATITRLRNLYWLVFTGLLVLAYFRVFYTPAPTTEAVILVTRGVAIPATPSTIEFSALVSRLRQEDAGSMLSILATIALMQIRVDGTIPLWGAIVLVSSLIGTAIGAVVALVRRMDMFASELKRHNEVDELRFGAITDRIELQHKEIREDLSKIKPR